jgi:hypothetical protein
MDLQGRHRSAWCRGSTCSGSVLAGLPVHLHHAPSEGAGKVGRRPRKLSQARTKLSDGILLSLFGDARWRRPRCSACCCAFPASSACGASASSATSCRLMCHRRLARRSRTCALPGHRSARPSSGGCGINLIVQNIGAFIGMIAFSKAAHRFGRKPAFAVGLSSPPWPRPSASSRCFNGNAPTSG